MNKEQELQEWSNTTNERIRKMSFRRLGAFFEQKMPMTPSMTF
jgi:hypothetical protein